MTNTLCKIATEHRKKLACLHGRSMSVQFAQHCIPSLARQAGHAVAWNVWAASPKKRGGCKQRWLSRYDRHEW